MVRRLTPFMPTLSVNKVYKAQIQTLSKYFVVKYGTNYLRGPTSKGSTACVKRYSEIKRSRVNAKLKVNMVRVTNPRYNF